MKLFGAILILGSTTVGWANPAQSVTVCLKGASEKYVSASTRMASEIFATAGVEIDWRDARACPSSPNVIKVTFLFIDPVEYQPEALAYALPFEGSTINILYSRIARQAPASIPQVLAYVLAHEITHILQGVCQHSKEGIMKAKWGPQEFSAMRTGSLGFSAEDVLTIDLGLHVRARRAAARRAEVAAR